MNKQYSMFLGISITATILAITSLLALVTYYTSKLYYTYSPNMIDPDSAIKNVCSYTKHKLAPTIMIQVTQSAPLDVRDPKFDIIEYNLNPNGTIDTPRPPLPPYSMDVFKTRLDMYLNLDPIEGKDRRRIRLMFKLLPTASAPPAMVDDITFHYTDNLAITSTDKNSKMFCFVSNDAKTAVIDVDYFDQNTGSSKPKFGSYNLNIIVPDKTLPLQYNLPISLDPEVRNHG